MEINRLNYEIYFLDYLEGNLPGHLVREFELFLQMNPDLKDELALMESEVMVGLPEEEILFDAKDLLKKKVSVYSDHNDLFETHCIAAMEGDLSIAEQAAFDQYLSENPEKLTILASFAKTRLIPDHAVRYPEKSRIKRMGIIPVTQYQSRYVWSVAATFLILFLSYLFFENAGNHVTPELAFVPRSANSGYNFSGPEEIIPGESMVQEVVPGKEDPSEVVRVERLSEPESVYQRMTSPGFAGLIGPRKLEVQSITHDAIAYRDILLYPAAGSEQGKEKEPFTPKQYATYLFKNRLLNQPAGEIDPDRIYAWEIADAGLRGIGKLTGREVTFNRVEGVDGSTSLIEINSGRLGFSRSFSGTQE
jgi:hypothetical protein